MNTHPNALGMIGLGTMGRNLALNLADHGFEVAGYDAAAGKVEALCLEAANRTVRGSVSLEEFVGLLPRPRTILMLLPAGPGVDATLEELRPHLAAGDLIVDVGNSYFKDTDARARKLTEHEIGYLGAGISGGEHGARYGACIMCGGQPEDYQRVRPVLEAVAAWVNNEPSVAWLGPGSAGHYVKMVHNGIECGLMRLMAESYDLMKRGLSLTDDELHDVYDRWNREELSSYLLEITAHIFRNVDDGTGRRLIDLVPDDVKQKGTGLWAAQEAMELTVAVPTIDLAVAMRNLSVASAERDLARQSLHRPIASLLLDRGKFLEQLRDALYVAMLITYAQGMAQLQMASQVYGYNLNLLEVARIWRGGSVIRAVLLEKIHGAYRRQPDLPCLLIDPQLSQEIMARQEGLRMVVCAAANWGIPAPALMVTLGYLDGYRSEWLPVNLLQAQRDFLGAQACERSGAKGALHTEWSVDWVNTYESRRTC